MRDVYTVYKVDEHADLVFAASFSIVLIEKHLLGYIWLIKTALNHRRHGFSSGFIAHLQQCMEQLDEDDVATAYIAAGAMQSSKSASSFFAHLSFKNAFPVHLKMCDQHNCEMFFFRVQRPKKIKAGKS